MTADLRSARVVVTGSAGFIGRHVVRALLERGADVVGIDRRDADASPGSLHWRAELTDDRVRPDLAAELASADVVLHLAGRAGVRSAGPGVEAARRRDNVLATAVVLACTPRATPLVVASSSSIYGGARVLRGVPVPSHEDDPPWPRGAYARSKVLVERLCARRAAQGGVVRVARPFTVAGPGQRPDMAIAGWLAAARRGRPLPLFGAPDRARDVTDVRQVADALAALAAQPGRGAVNVGTGRPVTLGRMVEVVGRVLDVPVAIEVSRAHPDDPALTCADPRRLERLIGWSPETDLEDLIRAQAGAGPGDGDLHSRVASANMA